MLAMQEPQLNNINYIRPIVVYKMQFHVGFYRTPQWVMHCGVRYRKASSRGALSHMGHDPFLNVFEELRLNSTTDITMALCTCIL